MSASTERLRQEVTENTSAVESALVCINGLSARLREALASEDVESEVAALADELDQNNVKLATAVAANTLAAEDSDSFNDPSPVGETAPEVGGSEPDSTGDEPTDEPVSDTSPTVPELPPEDTDSELPTGDEVVEANQPDELDADPESDEEASPAA